MSRRGVFNRYFMSQLSRKLGKFSKKRVVDVEKVNEYYNDLLYKYYEDDIISWNEMDQWTTPKQAYNFTYLTGMRNWRLINKVNVSLTKLKDKRMFIDLDGTCLDVEYALLTEPNVRDDAVGSPGNPGSVTVQISYVTDDGVDITKTLSSNDMDYLIDYIFEHHESD